jgi:hypothetical protein
LERRNIAAADEMENRNAGFKSEMQGRQELSDDISMGRLKSGVEQSVAEVPGHSVSGRRNTQLPEDGQAVEISGNSVYELHNYAR